MCGTQRSSYWVYFSYSYTFKIYSAHNSNKWTKIVSCNKGVELLKYLYQCFSKFRQSRTTTQAVGEQADHLRKTPTPKIAQVNSVFILKQSRLSMLILCVTKPCGLVGRSHLLKEDVSVFRGVLQTNTTSSWPWNPQVSYTHRTSNWYVSVSMPLDTILNHFKRPRSFTTHLTKVRFNIIFMSPWSYHWSSPKSTAPKLKLCNLKLKL
jgi:hypothetical protein